MVKRTKDDLYVYAEGGGSGAHSESLNKELRKAFAAFFAKTDLGNTRRPRVVACGGREQAFDSFRTAIQQGRNAMLLVDSEEPLKAQHQPPHSPAFRPWSHLSDQAGWSVPAQATDQDAHLMAQCMESWFLADWNTVAAFFGHGFKAQAKPASTCESTSKAIVYAALQSATASCRTKLPYGKGAHSFKLLGLIDPNSVEQSSPWAKRFLDELRKRKP